MTPLLRAVRVMMAIAVTILGVQVARADVTDAGAGAAEWRIPTAWGPVRAWRPEGHRPQTAAIVVYVHDYYIGVDRAWREHELVEQFAASGIDAMFVACPAAEDSAEPIGWQSLASLLASVEPSVGLPDGDIIVIAHGGGARTVRAWLDEPRLRSVVLLDSEIVSSNPFLRWSRAAAHSLISVVRPDSMIPSYRGRTIIDGFSRLARMLETRPFTGARLYVRSALDRAELVTDGASLPLLLRATGAPRIADAQSMPSQQRTTLGASSRFE